MRSSSRVFDQPHAAFEPLPQCPEDGRTRQDVLTKLVDEVESAERAEKIAPAQDVGAELGERVRGTSRRSTARRYRSMADASAPR